MTRTLSFIFALIMLVAPATVAQDDRGPAVGSAIPHDLSAVDSTGARQNFNTLKGDKGAVLVFYRSAEWCPFCQRQLITLNSIADDVKQQGYNMVAISYDDIGKLSSFKDKRRINYTLLSDEKSRIIDAFDIRNKAYGPGHYAEGVPHPIVFVVGSDGIIKSKFYKESYRDRPENKVILEAVSAD